LSFKVACLHACVVFVMFGIFVPFGFTIFLLHSLESNEPCALFPNFILSFFKSM
jgi:hypothetical protein